MIQIGNSIDSSQNEFVRFGNSFGLAGIFTILIMNSGFFSHLNSLPFELIGIISLQLRMELWAYKPSIQAGSSGLVVDPFPVVRRLHILKAIGMILDQGFGVFIPKSSVGVVAGVCDHAITESCV